MATKIADQIKSILNPFTTEVGKDIKKLTDSKQDKLKPGLNITISTDGIISSTGAGEAPDLSNYPTTARVGTIVDGKLADYVKTEALTTALTPYAKTEALDAYAKKDEVVKTADLEGLVTFSLVEVYNTAKTQG